MLDREVIPQYEDRSILGRPAIPHYIGPPPMQRLHNPNPKENQLARGGHYYDMYSPDSSAQDA